VPVGLGEPVFDRLEADLAKAMLSLPATKGFEIGSGFAGTLLKGSQHNDAFVSKGGRIRTATNHSGGVQGGISNGEDIVFRTAFKPTATILQTQKTVDVRGQGDRTAGPRRHDPCVLPRAVVIVEAMAGAGARGPLDASRSAEPDIQVLRQNEQNGQNGKETPLGLSVILFIPSKT